MTPPAAAAPLPPQGGAPGGPAEPDPRLLLDGAASLARSPRAALAGSGADGLGAAGAVGHAAALRLPRKAVHGVLLLDKPLGWTSNDALQKTKGLLRALKGGHTGTLDPLATGLLPLCFGAATKFAQASLDADKRYRATLTLGRRTSTGDLEGELLAERAVTCTRQDVQMACERFVGTQQQLPPMHSALKHGGRALYEYARAGVEVERAKREVTVYRIELVVFDSPQLVIDVCCSKGTYIRTLAEDIGEALGCGAHLSALRRTGSGALDVADAISVQTLQELPPEKREARLLPPDVLLADWPPIELPEQEAARFLTGLRRRIQAADMPQLRVYGPAPEGAGHMRPAFLGSAHSLAGELIADRLLSPAEVLACTTLETLTT